jgi:exodeoxyribonuclease V gamma subunit
VGQSIQDNSKIPPSVMVSELCDYLCKSYDIAEADLITEHRLQPFAPEYFSVPTSGEHPRWFSFSQTDCQAAGLLDADREVVPVFRSALPEDSPVGDPIELDQVIAFFDHPARYLLQERLGVRFPADTEGLEEREPFHVDALTAYRMKQEMLQKQIAGQDLNRLEAAYLQRGVLPHGPQAQLEFDRLCASTQAFAEKINRFRRVGRRSSVDVDLHPSKYHLTGRLNDVYASGIIGVRYGRTRGKDLVGLWIRHLALAASGWNPAEGSARLVCQDKIWQLSAIPNPEELLVDLLGFFRKGLRIPAHYFPETSYQFAHQVYQQGRTETQALKAARNVWLGNAYSISRAESQDPYYHLCFRYADPLDEEFCRSAALIFKPLFAHLTELL